MKFFGIVNGTNCSIKMTFIHGLSTTHPPSQTIMNDICKFNINNTLFIEYSCINDDKDAKFYEIGKNL